jgi:transposase
MKTIYERLNPDILASINNDEQRYPYTTKALKIKLKNSICWDELSISDIKSIITHSHVKIIDVDQIDFMWGDKFLTNGTNNNR